MDGISKAMWQVILMLLVCLIASSWGAGCAALPSDGKALTGRTDTQFKQRVASDPFPTAQQAGVL
jgi:hypothetical protein